MLDLIQNDRKRMHKAINHAKEIDIALPMHNVVYYVGVTKKEAHGLIESSATDDGLVLYITDNHITMDRL